MVAVEFLHHEIPPTWAGVEPATLDAKDQRQTNHASHPGCFVNSSLSNIYFEIESLSPSQYGGYDPRLVTEWVRIPTDRTTWKRIRYGFITIKSTTLIGFHCPRKNTTLPAIRFVELRRTHIPV
ncbi:hypothetical protein TNCV_3068851 [Trichonephila clavipes]|nr:hypothetical protein TNCV_3068851 [Trichonephila clavipes]